MEDVDPLYNDGMGFSLGAELWSLSTSSTVRLCGSAENGSLMYEDSERFYFFHPEEMKEPISTHKKGSEIAFIETQKGSVWETIFNGKRVEIFKHSPKGAEKIVTFDSRVKPKIIHIDERDNIYFS